MRDNHSEHSITASGKGGSKRNTNIEILRFILMCSIFFLHVMGHGFDLYSAPHENGIRHLWQICLVTLFAPAVDCFMFISGYYGIRYSLKKFISLLLQCILAILFISFVWSFAGGFEISWLNPFGPLWFINCYIFIFMLSPIINKGLASLSQNQLKLILGVLLAYQLYEFLTDAGSDYSVQTMLTVYLTGRYCSMFGVTLGVRKATLIITSCIVIQFAIAASLEFSSLSGKGQGHLLCYHNPMVFLIAVSIFYMFLSFKPFSSAVINAVLRPCLFIYLLTEAGHMELYKYVAIAFSSNFFLGLLLSLAIIAACLAIGFVITKAARSIVAVMFRVSFLSNTEKL